VIGSPDEEDIECIESDKARRYIRSLPYKPHIPTEKIFPNANPLALSLLVRPLPLPRTSRRSPRVVCSLSVPCSPTRVDRRSVGVAGAPP